MPYLFQPPIFAAQAATTVLIPQQQPRVIYTASPATLFRPATLLGGVPLIGPPPATTFVNLQQPPPPPPPQQQFVLSAPMYAVFAPPALPPPRWFP